MNDGKIHIPGKHREYAKSQAVVSVTPEAYNMLIDVVDESGGLSMRQIASLIITQAVEQGLIHFDKREE